MRASIILCLAVLASCAREQEIEMPDVLDLPQRPGPTVVARTSLTINASGVSVDASGQRYLWASGVGLHRLTPDGLVLEFDASLLGANAVTQYDDVAIIDADRLALITENEGIVVDRKTGSVRNRFCYLPGFQQEQDPSSSQLSRALAYDSAEDRLYVQPQTFTGFGRALTSSQVGLFDPAISEPLEWQNLNDRTFNAGGMTVATRENTFFSMGTRIYRYDALNRAFETWWDLLGIVQSTEGLALDRTTNTMLVLDTTSHELVELRLDGML